MEKYTKPVSRDTQYSQYTIFTKYSLHRIYLEQTKKHKISYQYSNKLVNTHYLMSIWTQNSKKFQHHQRYRDGDDPREVLPKDIYTIFIKKILNNITHKTSKTILLEDGF